MWATRIIEIKVSLSKIRRKIKKVKTTLSVLDWVGNGKEM